jgi:hypothetical protein
MTKFFLSVKPQTWALTLIVSILFLYFFRVDADSIAGLFGVFAADEGPFLLAAKQQVFFGTPHHFPGDEWRPELWVSLLHYYGLLTISSDDAVVVMRMGIGIFVVTGMALIARLAGKYHQDRSHALACFLCLLLNPILFFYARLGLSESLQFFILSVILTLLFRIGTSQSAKEVGILCTTLGALTACLFLAKIGAFAICVAIGAGLIAAVYGNAALSYRFRHIGFFTAAGMATFLFVVLIVMGPERAEWFRTNLLASNQLHLSLSNIALGFVTKQPYLAYFFCLMPIFYLYFLSLLAASSHKKGFVFTLFVITLTVIFFESFTMPSIRRNFYSIAMLTALSGFVVLDYIRNGISLRFWDSTPKTIAMLFIAGYLSGVVMLLRWSIQKNDKLYILFCALSLLIIIIVFASTARPYYARARKMMIALVGLVALVPMLFQAFFSPSSRDIIVRTVEEMVPEDATIISYVAPWYLYGLHRKMIFTNCVSDFSYLTYVNDINKVNVTGKTYFMGSKPLPEDPCGPMDKKNYRYVSQFRLFIPENYGGLLGVSSNWVYTRVFYLYEKQ